MTQLESPSIFRIKKWAPPLGDHYSNLVKVDSPLIIFPILGDQSLLWLDQVGNLCLIRSLNSTDPIARVGVTGISDCRIQVATVQVTEGGAQVTLTFDDGQAGPVGTITAEVNPPIELPVLARLWRRLRSLFLRLFSLFR